MARGLGVGLGRGEVGPGLAGDLRGVDGKPLGGLAALRTPRLVVSRGRLVD